MPGSVGLVPGPVVPDPGSMGGVLLCCTLYVCVTTVLTCWSSVAVTENWCCPGVLVSMAEPDGTDPAPPEPKHVAGTPPV